MLLGLQHGEEGTYRDAIFKTLSKGGTAPCVGPGGEGGRMVSEDAPERKTEPCPSCEGQAWLVDVEACRLRADHRLVPCQTCQGLGVILKPHFKQHKK